jgi:VanZ family protein
MQHTDEHLFPRNISLKNIREYFFPNVKALEPALIDVFARQAAGSLFLIMLIVTVLSAFIVAISIPSNIGTLDLVKSLFAIFGFFGVVVALHKILKCEKRDIALLFATIVFIASWGVAKDIFNFGIIFNSYGTVYVAIVFFGLIFMPFAPRVSLALGVWCAALYVLLWAMLIFRVFGDSPVTPLTNMFGLEWLPEDFAGVGDKIPPIPHYRFYIAWHVFEYFIFGAIAFVFRAANMRTYIKAFRTSEKLQNAEIELKATQALLSRHEDHRLEFKSSSRWDFRANKTNKEIEQVIVKTVAGFMNSDGGILLIGVNDDGSPVGLEHDIASLGRKDTDGYEAFLVKLIADNLGAENCANVAISFLSVEGKDICALDIKRNEQPIFIEKLDGAFYIRTGNNTQQLNPREAMEYIGKRFKGSS